MAEAEMLMKPFRFPILLTWLMPVLFTPGLVAQPEEAPTLAEAETEGEAFRPHHAIGVVISHAHVREGINEGRSRWLGLPSFGLDYNYHFHPRWMIGLHTDFIFEEFIVERHLESGEESEVLERSFPIAPALMGTYRLGKRRRFALMFGPGVEFASGESFFLTRMGLEYGVELPNEWEVFASFNYDIKWNAYDSFVFGLGVGKAFGHRIKRE